MRLGLRIALASLGLALATGAFALSKPGVQAIVGLATGTNVSFVSERISLDHALLRGVSVRSRTGEPILQAGRIEASYNIGELLTGKRLFGLHDVTICDPHLTLIRHRDGSWNYSLPTRNKNVSGPPVDLDGTICNGSLTLIDQTQGVAALREADVRNVNAELHVHARTTRYRVAAQYLEAGRAHALRADGDIDPSAGYGALALASWASWPPLWAGRCTFATSLQNAAAPLPRRVTLAKAR